MTIRRYTLDFDQLLLEVELADGTTLSEQVPSDLFGGPLDARTMVVDAVDRELALGLSDGHEITFELGAAGAKDTPPIGRPVVYLDQLHWVTLAQQLWSPEKVREPDRAAAADLIELAQIRHVVLPFAAAHLAEARTFGKQRRDFIKTVFTLSRGWQMRDPIEVRRRELLASMSSQPPVAEVVITLRPDVLFSESSGLPSPPADFSLDWQELHQRLTSVSALYAAMIEDADPKSKEARDMAERWARSHHELALYMREHKTPKDHARLNARAALLSDMQTEIAGAAATAGLGADAFGAWLEHSFPDDLPRMPYLGRVHEGLYERLRNADDKWEGNDLFDTYFLSCAAGYVDLLVCEKKASGLLQRVDKRVTPGAYVCRTLPEAINHLRTLGVAKVG